MSIKNRIYLIALLFAFLFLINRIVAFISVYKTRKTAENIVSVTDPSIIRLDQFQNMVLLSKMNTASWIFFKDNQYDKEALIKIHEQYPTVKTKLLHLSQQWKAKNEADSLAMAFSEFEKILVSQKAVMALLHQSQDYTDPTRKQQAVEIFRGRIAVQTDSLYNLTGLILSDERDLKSVQENILSELLRKFWFATIILTIVVLCGLFILAKYLGDFIIKPVDEIRNVVDGLTRGVTDRIDRIYKQDEIGKMVTSVNHLSDRLREAACFARNVGERHFDVPFRPRGQEDALGNALVAMRDNLKFVDESLNEAQRIARIGNWRWDLGVNKVFWSDELYQVFEKDPASFTPSLDGFASCVHKDDREFAIETVRKSLTDHQPFLYQCRILSQGGAIKKILVQGKLIVDGNDNAVTMFGIVQDITRQVEREVQLIQTTERFHNLSKATDDSIWDWNLQTDEVWWNDNFYNVFGYDPAEGTPSLGEWILKMHPDDREVIVTKLKGIKTSTADSWRDEFRYFKKDGTIGIGLNRAYIIRDEERIPIRIIGAIHDITERRKAIQQLADSEKRYRQIVETAEEGIWLVDENNRTVFVNKKLCEMLEYPTDEIMGRPEDDFKHESEKKDFAEQMDRRSKGLREQYEGSYITKSGKRLWVFVSANPVFDDEGNYKGALGMLTDITQRKLQEQLIRKSEADLEIKNRELKIKNTELEQFAYIASHDLQEPLRTVTSFAELFQKQYKDRVDDIGQKYLYFIQQGTERMKTLITDLLDYSRIGRGKELRPVDCNKIINTVIADLDTAIREAEAEIKTENLPVVNGYRTEMKQLFQNLIVNAIKFRKKEVVPEIRISSQPIKGGWEFRVQDNGIGIEEQFEERIFAIFQRLHTRNEYEGSGIGLSHCKKIVELHGGRIWVRSKPGEGSTFHFTILGNHN